METTQTTQETKNTMAGLMLKADDFTNLQRVVLKNKEETRWAMKGIYLKDGQLYFTNGKEAHQIYNGNFSLSEQVSDGFYNVVSIGKKDKNFVNVIIEGTDSAQDDLVDQIINILKNTDNAEYFKLDIPKFDDHNKTQTVIQIYNKFGVILNSGFLPFGYDRIGKATGMKDCVVFKESNEQRRAIIMGMKNDDKVITDIK